MLAAIKNNQTVVVEYLLDEKVATEPALYNPSALHLAAYRNHAECIRLILQHKAKIGDPEIDPLNDSRVRETPLHVATRQGYFESCSLLLEFGANPKAVNGLGEMALHIACRKKCPNIMSLLLDNKFQVGHVFTFHLYSS